jgi:hypothetical protein
MHIPSLEKYLFLRFRGEVLLVVRFVDDQLCFFGLMPPPRHSAPQLRLRMAKYVLLDFVLILPQVRGPSEFLDGAQWLTKLMLVGGDVIKTRWGWAYH